MNMLALLCAAIAGFCLPRGTPPAARRLAGLLSDQNEAAPRAGRSDGAAGGDQGSRSGAATRPDRQAAWRHRIAAVLAGLACAVLLGGFVGLVAGAGVAVACARLLAGLEPKAVRERRARLIADLPVAVDLLAACLRGGGSWDESVVAVAAALGGPVGAELRWVAAQIRLGADPAATWLVLADEPALAGLARAAARASVSGSALAPMLARLAQNQRRSAQAEAAARARSAGVRAVAPLGLCFLPAFVLIGIVPAVAGIATEVLLP
jgi:Flp pilus assembly protein TadB